MTDSKNQNSFHEIASIFPLMGDDELQELADDIRENGLRNPIMRYEGQILDGRNRLTACKLAGVDPQFEEFAGDAAAAVAFVWSENFQRRHLDSSQRAMAEAKRAKTVESYAAAIEQAKKEAANRSKEAGKQGGKEGGRGKKKTPRQQIDKGFAEPKPYAPFAKHAIRTDEKRSKAAGTNRQYLNDAEKILEQAPDLAQRVEAGEMKITQAKLEMKRRDKRAQLKQAEAQAIETTWKIINEDCLNALQEIRPNSAQLIFADPPYNIGIDYGRGKEADRLPDKDFLNWCDEWIELCWETLCRDGTLWVMISDEYAAEIAVALKDYGFHIRAWVKWYETFGVNCANNFNRTSRHLFYCIKNPKIFTFNDSAVRTPSARQVKYRDKRANENGKIWDDVWQVPRLTGTSEERIPDFPTQVPLEITRAIVGCCSNPGDLVVDPFCGSGSTGVAAIELRRNFIGIEWEEKFCDLAGLRLKGTAHAPATPTPKTQTGPGA